MSTSMRCGVVAVAVAMAAVFAQTAAGDTSLESAPAFVFLRPETSSFWRTATNSVVSLPVKFPEGATTATLTVTGASYSRTYENLAKGWFNLELPSPDRPESENVYDLVLSFDHGAAQTAKLGLVQGLMPDAEGATRCIVPEGGTKWKRVRPRAVLPIPYGATSFSVFVNGVQTANDTGLGGAKGWYALDGIERGDNVVLSFATNGVDCVATLLGTGNPGFMFIYR